jgi:UDP-N-acetylmuramoyl-tripeptide--D-alanyl-D-alanine ligase
MATAVVSRRFSTLFPKKNFNNQIGVPLTLLDLRDHHQWVVLELGTNQHGEIKALTDICIPDLGMITNIGPAHLEGLGSIDGVMKEKGALVKNLPSSARAILNADDPRVAALAEDTHAEVIFYGISSHAHIRATDVEQTVEGIRFTLILPESRITIELSVPGYFMVSNALAAAAVGYILNIDEKEIKQALEKDFEPAPGRMCIHRLIDGVRIIDDTYNANPGSMEVALRTFKAMRKNARGALVIGDMLELGNHSSELHYQIGVLAVDLDVSKIYAAGNYAEDVAKGARSQGLDSRNIIVGSFEHLLSDLDGWLQPNDWVLIKGSRGMKMEKIVNRLKLKRT